MRLTKRSSPLLLFLLASCVAAAAVPDTNAKPGSVEHLDDLASDSSNTASPPARNPETGTKDAPVDGLDGKPHAGPYVEGNRRKPIATIEDISKKKGISDEVKAITKGGKEDGFEIPDKKELDSVMGDRGDSKDGPKGTEGGVSEKDRKAKENGPKEGKKPIAPTEAAEIPAHAPQHGDAKEKPLKKEEDKEKEKEKSKGSFGLEVCFALIFVMRYCILTLCTETSRSSRQASRHPPSTTTQQRKIRIPHNNSTTKDPDLKHKR